MKLIASVTAAAAVLSAGVFGSLSTANASVFKPRHAPVTISGGQHACTETSPSYLLANDGTRTTLTPHSYKFTAKATRPGWDDAYLLNGLSRGNNSADLCGQFPYVLPVPATNFNITGSMTSKWTGYYARPGWDIWLVHAGSQDTETTNTTMQADPRTVELLLQPGFPEGHAYQSAPGWHRIFTNSGDLKNVNITAMINQSLATAGLRPSDYYISAIGAGAELVSATFKLTGYNLSMTPKAHLQGHVTH